MAKAEQSGHLSPPPKHSARQPCRAGGLAH
jgi:hypothetical protein